MGIKELDKPRNAHCLHCAVNVGCTIYDTRPRECGTFYCAWLFVGDIPDEWRPDESGLVLHFDALANRMEVHVDPERPEAWRAEPYNANLHAWAAASAPDGGQVIIWVGEELFAVLPDRDKALGHLDKGQLIVSHEFLEDGTWFYDIEIMDETDPRLAGVR
jgi:hypothetical protein